jgi:hypothetical protein
VAVAARSLGIRVAVAVKAALLAMSPLRLVRFDGIESRFGSNPALDRVDPVLTQAPRILVNPSSTFSRIF